MERYSYQLQVRNGDEAETLSNQITVYGVAYIQCNAKFTRRITTSQFIYVWHMKAERRKRCFFISSSANRPLGRPFFPHGG